jgi:hypothetical protein
VAFVATGLQGVDFGYLTVTMDDPHLGHAEFCVKRQLLIGFVAGTVDFHDHVWCALKILVAIDSETLRTQEHEIGNTIVVGPAARRGEIDLMVHFGTTGTGPTQPPCQT